MRKTILLMSVFTLISFIFTSCKVKEEKKERVTLSVMGYGDNTNQEGVIWYKQVAEFQKMHPEIIIESELLYNKAYHQKVLARLAANDAPMLHIWVQMPAGELPGKKPECRWITVLTSMRTSLT